MTTPRNPWIPTREFFALAEGEGIDLVVAAEELLKAIKGKSLAPKIAGLRRQWDSPSEAESREWYQAESKLHELCFQREGISETNIEARAPIETEMKRLQEFIDTKYDWRERLPRDPQLRVVPKTFWWFIAGVQPDLTSIWIDDPEDPSESISIEWLPGTITSFLWFEYEAYEALCIDKSQAKELIKLLAGRTDRRGAPKGPRRPEEKLVIQSVLAAISNGDTRDFGKIVWDFIAPDVKKTPEGDLIQRRVKSHVKAHIQGAKNDG